MTQKYNRLDQMTCRCSNFKLEFETLNFQCSGSKTQMQLKPNESTNSDLSLDILSDTELPWEPKELSVSNFNASFQGECTVATLHRLLFHNSTDLRQLTTIASE